jgi:transketolase
LRTAFIETLCELAEQNDRIWLLCGDLGYSVLERFAQRFPNRYVNVGVAEQNMTGLAVGLSMCNKIVFTYSIANFNTFRCIEQIRNDVCYHNANVKIVSVGGGFTYGTQGYSHYAVEDLAIMRALPNITIIAPGDPIEARLAVKTIIENEGPCYLRLGKAGEELIHKNNKKLSNVSIRKAIVVQEGKDITLISTGGMLKTAIGAADRISKQRIGISVRVLSMPTIKPIDKEAIFEAIRETSAIFTIEDHSIIGGMGSAVAEVFAEYNSYDVIFLRLGIRDTNYYEIGDQKYLYKTAGLDVDGVVSKILEKLF